MIELTSHCDTMKQVRQVDDLLVCFGAKPNKGLSFRSQRHRKWARERLEKELREAVGEGRRRGAVDTGQQKRPVGMR